MRAQLPILSIYALGRLAPALPYKARCSIPTPVYIHVKYSSLLLDYVTLCKR